jgi:hypothetical protein
MTYSFLCTELVRLCGVLYIRQQMPGGAYASPCIFIHHHKMYRRLHAAWRASESILTPLVGGFMQELASELPRIPLLRASVNN